MLQKCFSIKHIGKIYTEVLDRLQLVKFGTGGFDKFRKPMWNLTALEDSCSVILVQKFRVFIADLCCEGPGCHSVCDCNRLGVCWGTCVWTKTMNKIDKAERVVYAASEWLGYIKREKRPKQNILVRG